MALLRLLQDFAASLTENFGQHTLAAQPEDQLKAPVTKLLTNAGTEFGVGVVPRTEALPTNLHARPDIGVTTDGLLCGFVELKAPGLGADPSRLRGEQNKKQWKKFKALPNLIYTDGNSWALFRVGEQVGSTVRFAGDVTEDGADAVDERDACRLAALLHDFLMWAPIVPHTSPELAHYLAPLTRLLRDEVHEAARQPESAIAIIAGQWRDRLFPNADDHQFADAYAQTLTYALLLARLSGAKDLTPDKAADILDDRNGLLAQTLRVLGDRDARKEIALGFGPLKRALEALDPYDFMRRSPDPWLYFYEDFLAAYDPRLRNDYGVYYTPLPVVHCQVRLISELLRDRFDKRLSFADDGVTFLDPAVGTGTYPLAAIDHALALVEARSGKGAVPGRASQLARNFFGFEALVGPYAVAHLRLTQKLTAEEVGGTLPFGRVQVYLADILDSPNTLPQGLATLMDRKLIEERRQARLVKAEQYVLVCLGNPPYDHQQIDPEDRETHQPKGGWVRKGDQVQGRVGERDPCPILMDFIEPAREAGAGVHLKNLYNDYVYFWRWALWKLFEQQYVYFWRWALWKLFEQQDGGGIVSFITAASYLAGPGFVGMREVMRRTFDELWIINLEGDNRGARRTENVFAIQTPVAIAVGVRQGHGDPNTPAKVWYTKVEGEREAKLTWLDAVERFDQVAWQVCAEGWHAPFLPKGHGDYFAWPLLTDVFPWQENGIQFKRTWPIGETANVLRRRWRDLMEANANDRRTLFRETDARRHNAFYRNFMSGEALPSIEQELSAGVELHPRMYGFRTLDRHHALIDVRLADRIRPELCRAHSLRQLYLTSLLSFELGEGPAATVTHLLPDLHHYCGRGGKDIVPLWRDAGATEANIARGIVERLQEVLAVAIRPEDLFAYAYSILANPGYVRRFWEEMATPGPRLPITKDAGLFCRAVSLGRHLVWLHTYGERMTPGGERNEVPQGAARCLAAVPDEPTRYPEDFSYDPVTREVHVGEGRFGPVAPEVYDFSVSGFEVVKSWLGYRMRERAGRRSSPLNEVRPERWSACMTDEFLELLWVLEYTLAMYPQLDDLLQAVVAGPIFTADELPCPSESERRPPQRRENERQTTLL